MKTHHRRLLILGSLLLAAWASTALAQQSPLSTTVLSHYVVLGFSTLDQAPAALARAIIDGAGSSCPAVVFDDGRASVPMQARPNPDPAAFAVTVCEAVVDLGAGPAARVQGQAAPLPLLGTDDLAKIVVVGDSGCDGAPHQVCDDPTQWQFPAIAAAAARAAPDLVIHVGDYNYRGTPSKSADDQWVYDGCLPDDGKPLTTQRTKDTWATWKEDFFDPARPLLVAAPWVALRGNHELCSRAGQGWFYFLDPHSTLLDPYAPLPSCSAPTMQTEPYALSLPNLELVILDTANACGGEAPQSAAATRNEVFSYTQQLNTVNAIANEVNKPAWLLTHRPLWGVAKWGKEPVATITVTLQTALIQTFRGELAPAFKLLVSGHMHQFEAITFAGDRPPQLIVGDSGVRVSHDALAPGFENLSIDRLDAHGMIDAASFGYLLIDLTDGGQFTAKLLEADADPGQTLATCALPLDRALCQR